MLMARVRMTDCEATPRVTGRRQVFFDRIASVNSGANSVVVEMNIVSARDLDFVCKKGARECSSDCFVTSCNRRWWKFSVMSYSFIFSPSSITITNNVIAVCLSVTP